MHLFLVFGALSIVVTPVQAGTLGECPNRGDRCYLNTNGVTGYQEGQDRYFPGGEIDARRDCSKRGGQYISNLSGSDYCTR